MADRNAFDGIYEVVRQIPKGRVSTYGSIAAFLGMKGGARMVGWAMNASHTLLDFPAHRVVNRHGMLTGKHFFGGDRMQQILESEGLKITQDLILDFHLHFWDPTLELI